MKNARIKKGTAKPSEYAVIKSIPASVSVAAKEITAIRIGPVQGVQPSEKAIPIKKDPIKPAGRFLK